MAYDVAIVGAGLLGLAHALAAARLGKRVIVFERDAQANGASIRNFGFVTVTGQEVGECWQMSRRSRDVWTELVGQAGIEILHRGTVIAARRPEAVAVLDAFLATEMGEGCAWLTAEQALDHCPMIRPDAMAFAHSPHELRVESRTAIPKLAAWLQEHHGVDFRWCCQVVGFQRPEVRTSDGVFEADALIVCPGDDFRALYADRLAVFGLSRCKLHMLRVRPGRSDPLGAAIVSDLTLARYKGYAALPEARELKRVLTQEQPAHLENGVHLIAVQSADGSLVVGDSHHYGTTPDPFSCQDIEALILGELESVLDLGRIDVTERWTGTYAIAADRWRLTDAPDEATRIVIVTAGCGASTAFAIGEETINQLYG